MTLSRAVIEQHAPAEVEEDDPLRALYRKLEFFPTPPWAARAVCELVKTIDPMAKRVWEPACGQGHFAGPAAEYFHTVHASDIYDFGFGQVNDFLQNPILFDDVEWIITNPPFAHAQSFVQMGLRVAKQGVAILVRLAFLATAGRHELLFGYPAHCCAVFSERVPMILGEWDPAASTMTEYCAIVWRKPPAAAHVRDGDLFARCVPTIAFPPGTCERLSRADDAARFAPARPQLNLDFDAPLFGRPELIVPKGET